MNRVGGTGRGSAMTYAISPPTIMQSQERDAKMAESDASASAWLSDRAAGWRLGALIAYAAVRSVVAAAAPGRSGTTTLHLDYGAPTEREGDLERAGACGRWGKVPRFTSLERAASGLLLKPGNRAAVAVDFQLLLRHAVHFRFCEAQSGKHLTR